MQTVAIRPQNKSISTSLKSKLTKEERWCNALNKEELKESIRAEMKTWNWKNEDKVFAGSQVFIQDYFKLIYGENIKYIKYNVPSSRTVWYVFFEYDEVENTVLVVHITNGQKDAHRIN